MEGIRLLQWDTDPILKHMGIRIEKKQTKTKALILQAPGLQFGMTSPRHKSKRPGLTGSWRMIHTHLLRNPPRPLRNWQMFRLDQPHYPAAAKEENWNRFYNVCPPVSKPGGEFLNEARLLGLWEIPTVPVRKAMAENIEKSIDDCMFQWLTGQNPLETFPQLLVFVVPDNNSHVYERINACCDTKYAAMSQVIYSGHINTGNAQAYSNIWLKIAAKLGATTMRAVKLGTEDPKNDRGKRVQLPPDYMKTTGELQRTCPSKLTMMIGADVSHPGALSKSSSFAAITMSMDADCIRYGAVVETNFKTSHGDKGGEANQRALQTAYRQAAAHELNKKAEAMGERGVYDEEDRGAEIPAPKPTKPIGWFFKKRALGQIFWENEDGTKKMPMDRTRDMRPIVRDFNYGMWFI